MPPSTTRRWTQMVHNKAKRREKTSFVVTTLNVLSPELLKKHTSLYKRDERIEDWDARRYRCVKELRSYEASVVCLQEVEASMAATFSVELGLELAVFSPCAGDRTDGVAIFYDHKRFALAEAEAIVLDAGAEKINACAIAVLDDGDRSLVVANAHLLFNPKRGDLRLRQARDLCGRLAAIVRDHEARRRDVGYVVLGDLNAAPDSPVYEFLATGSTRRIQKINERRNITAEQPYVPGWGHAGSGTSLLGHHRDDEVDDDDVAPANNPLDDLASVYAQPHPRLPRGCPGEPSFTTYISRGTKACVDYIFVGKRRLKPEFRLEPPNVHHLRRGLSASVSDHVALVARLDYRHHSPTSNVGPLMPS